MGATGAGWLLELDLGELCLVGVDLADLQHSVVVCRGVRQHHGIPCKVHQALLHGQVPFLVGVPIRAEQLHLEVQEGLQQDVDWV